MRIDQGSSITARDRMLVEWVAEAKVGDALPPPWSYSRTPLYSVVRTLMLIGVIGKPDPDTPLATVAREASVAARAWLEANPAPDRSDPASPSEPLGDVPPSAP